MGSNITDGIRPLAADEVKLAYILEEESKFVYSRADGNGGHGWGQFTRSRASRGGLMPLFGFLP